MIRSEVNPGLAAALEYIAWGWCVVPCQPVSKKPEGETWQIMTTAEQVREYWGEIPSANIAILAGQSHIVVLDADSEEMIAAAEKSGVEGALVVETGRGRHYYFKHPGGDLPNSIEIKPGLELISGRHLVIAPPSLHPKTKLPYKWLTKPNGHEPGPLPRWILDILHQKKPKATPAPGATIEEGSRNGALTSLAGKLRRDGLSAPEIEAALQAANRERCSPPLPEREVAAIAASVGRYEAAPVQSIAGLQTMTAAALVALEIPPIHWVVEKFLPAGLGTLSGKPKIGKSWFVLDLSLSVALGHRFLDQYDTDQGEVLFIGLEDGPRRLQDRLNMLLEGRKAPDTLHLATNLNRLDAGGIEQLGCWLDQHKTAKLIIIDTLGRIRPPGKKNEGLYQSDVSFLAPLQKLAQERNLSVFGVHHDRKMVASDPLDAVSGSTGFTGTADLLALFKRESRGRAQAELMTFSREAEGLEIGLSQDPTTCRWTYEGTALETRQSTERQQIIDLLHEAEEPMSPASIAQSLGKNKSTTQVLLCKMKRAGLIFQPSLGKWESI